MKLCIQLSTICFALVAIAEDDFPRLRDPISHSPLPIHDAPKPSWSPTQASDNVQPWERQYVGTCLEVARDISKLYQWPPRRPDGTKTRNKNEKQPGYWDPEGLKSRYWAAVRTDDRNLDMLDRKLDCLEIESYTKHKGGPEPDWMEGVRHRMALVEQQMEVVKVMKKALKHRKHTTDNLKAEEIAVDPSRRTWDWECIMPGFSNKTCLRGRS